MFNSIKEFLQSIGWGDWFTAFFTDDGQAVVNLSFGGFILQTIPAVMELCLIVWLLNWIMGIISDGCSLRFGGGRRMF